MKALLVLSSSFVLLGCGRVGFEDTPGMDAGVEVGVDSALEVGSDALSDAVVHDVGPDTAPADASGDTSAPTRCPEGTTFCRDPVWSGGADVELDIDGVDNVGFAVEPLVELGEGRLVVLAQRGTTVDIDYAILQLREDGSLEPSFGVEGIASFDSGASEAPHSIAALPDGRLLLTGERDGTLPQVVRLMADGRPDTTFGGDGAVEIDNPGSTFSTANGLVVVDAGLYLMGGQTRRGAFDFWAGRVDGTGALDPAFGTMGIVNVDFFGGDEFGTILPHGDGRFYFTGSTWNGASSFECAVARHLADGAPDPSWGAGGRATQDVAASTDRCGSLVVLADGSVLAGGVTSASGSDQPALYRFDSDGTPAAGYGTDGHLLLDLGGVAYVRAMIRVPDGRVVIGGAVTGADGDRAGFLQMLDASGVPVGEAMVYDYAPEGDDEVQALFVDSAGRLLVYGYTTNVDRDLFLMRLLF